MHTKLQIFFNKQSNFHKQINIKENIPVQQIQGPGLKK